MTTSPTQPQTTDLRLTEGLDPITFEVIRHRLWAINDDQARMAARLSGSPIVYEGYDFNAALTTPDGRGLYTGVYIMQHGSTLDEFIRKLLADWPADDIHEGDMFYTNDPWWGALHANDGVLAMPIFWNGTIVGWSGIVMHDSDVGSPVPSSFVVGATDRFGEAPLFPPVRMVENWEIKRDVERIKLRNTRTPETNALNMRARVAALRQTQQRIVELVDQYGLDAFLQSQEGIIDYVERVVRRRLQELPDGSWYAQGYLDHNGTTNDVYTICCRVTKRGDHLIVDFEGTSPQAPGPVNCARPAMEGAVIGVLLISLCYDLPWAVEGIRRVVDIRSREGTINNAVSPAAVSLASIQGTLTTQDITASAVSKMLLSSEKFRSEAQATWAPGVIFGNFAAIDRHGELAVEGVIDAFAGGGGARSFTDGVDSGGIYHSMGSRLGNAETYENRAPVLQMYRREVCDSGGPGRFRGGVSVGFGNIPHKAQSPVTMIANASGVSMPGGLGLSGGAPGAAVSNVILRHTDFWSEIDHGRVPVSERDVTAEGTDVLEAKDVTTVGGDDVVVSVTNAGSGYGDALRREPSKVAEDFVAGRVSTERARAVYGVVLLDGAVDEEATSSVRAEIRQERLAQSAPVNPDRTARTVDDGLLVHPVADTVEAVLSASHRLLRCTICHYHLGGYDEDYKQGGVVRERQLTTLTALNHLCQLDSYVLREFFCPGCGTLLVSDVQHKDEAIRDECRFFERADDEVAGDAVLSDLAAEVAPEPAAVG
jgi:N-methylhydantoinase B